MPIYEFYCERCNTIYRFFSRKVNTEKIPDCPNCKDSRLTRRPSLFATVSRGKESEAGSEINEARIERVLSDIAKDAEGLNEDDPREAAHLMRRLTDAVGLKMSKGMEEVLDRLEKGENPERIEEEMGDILDEEEPFTFEERQKRAGKASMPQIDETLYEL